MAMLALQPATSLTSTSDPLKQPYSSRNSSNVISLYFPSQSKHHLRFSAKGLQSNRNHSTLVKAQLNEVRHWFPLKEVVSVFRTFKKLFMDSSTDFVIDGDESANAATSPAPKSEGLKLQNKDAKKADKPSLVTLSSEASISEFMSQVSCLVKLVDSKDVVELQLKQSDCELVIRKKEALPQPPSPDNVVRMHSPPPPAVASSAYPPAPTPAPVSSSTQAPGPSQPAEKPKSSVPPLKCPMAGTFYRCPAPGEPAFVKVGDSVQKGQIVCIIEAMKLMNEIEADRSGKLVEVLVEDGKPVSVDTPLFVIEP